MWIYLFLIFFNATTFLSLLLKIVSNSNSKSTKKIPRIWAPILVANFSYFRHKMVKKRFCAWHESIFGKIYFFFCAEFPSKSEQISKWENKLNYDIGGFWWGRKIQFIWEIFFLNCVNLELNLRINSRKFEWTFMEQNFVIKRVNIREVLSEIGLKSRWKKK